MLTIKLCIAIFKREFLLTFRNYYDVLTIITFFILGILIFIFAIGPEEKIYSQIGIGIIWTLLLLSTNLSIKKFYQDDFNDGSIILFFISGVTYELIVILKIITAWLFFQFPFLVIIPIAWHTSFKPDRSHRRGADLRGSPEWRSNFTIDLAPVYSRPCLRCECSRCRNHGPSSATPPPLIRWHVIGCGCIDTLG